MNREQYFALIELAVTIVAKKNEDYNSGLTLESYFPFGHWSYCQMLHVKSQRLVSLAQSAEPNFESVEDTLLDMINYAVFYLKAIKEQTV